MRFLTGIALLLVIPMIVLNPLGRSAFLGYYTGVIATWSAAHRTENLPNCRKSSNT